MSFLTLEDINTTLFSYGRIYYHKINTMDITETNKDYNEVKLDFVKVTREKQSSNYTFTFEVDNSSWTGGYYFTNPDGSYYEILPQYNQGKIIVSTPNLNICLVLLLIPNVDFNFDRIWHRLDTYEYFFDYSHYNPNTTNHIQGLNIPVYNLNTGRQYDTITELSDWGLNAVPVDNNNDIAYLYAILVKSNFKFQCTTELVNAKVNTVPLGTDTDYKPNGSMVGTHTPRIEVIYNDETLPVTWNSQLNDYAFDIDLTNREKETDIVLTVFVDNNEVLNQTSTDIRLHTRFENIDSITKLNTLFQNGGIGRLNTDLILTNDLTISNDVYLIGNHHNINMADNKFIISENKTFKCEETSFSNGENTIQQKLGSKVELTRCNFINCTGLGSVIDCQIDIKSLTNPNDFTTNLEKCVFDSCDMMILHGGELSVTNCTVNGANTKIDNPNYPFFLYQTDGTARILQSEFNFIPDTDIDEDIEFNSCIFVCGETAEINGYDHTELQKNNLTQFLEIQRNTSKIDVTYYYNPIEDYITLQSNNGFCHAVSNVDYVFKTNVTPERR